MEYVLDRIEAGFAVLAAPDGALLRLPAWALPAGVAAGTVLREAGGVLVPDKAKTEARRAALLTLQQKLLSADGDA
ncbi:MAG: DUF3006 domain-containing protein [Clostridia bacterium]|nr:DUF3006 domain-containing protein [Clostridia bacterium]